MTNIIGPILICLGVIGLAYGVYLVMFSNRDKRSDRQKNLDSITEIRGDKHSSNPAKKPKAGKSKAH